MFGVQDIDGRVYDETNEGECEAKNDEGTSSAGVIR